MMCQDKDYLRIDTRTNYSTIIPIFNRWATIVVIVHLFLINNIQGKTNISKLRFLMVFLKII